MKASDLHAKFWYCPDKGKIYRKRRPREDFKTEKGFLSWNKNWADTVALDNNSKAGYLTGYHKGTNIYAHRAIFLMHHGYLPEEVDHINGNRRDNRICNLRPVDRINNAHNLGVSKRNRSGVPGVHRMKSTGHYYATICVNWESIYLGYYRTIQEAVDARKRAEKKYGYHQNHGARRAEG